LKKLAGILLLALVMVLTTACSSSTSSKPSKNADGASWTPDKSIEIVAPSSAGGGWDTTARMAAKFLKSEGLINKNIGVVNKTGGGGSLGWAYVHQKNSPEELFVTSPPMLLVPLTTDSKFTYKDFTPIANVIADYGTFAVKDDSKYNSVTDLFDAMKKDPSSITVVGASSPGSMDEIQFLKAAKVAGVDVKKVKYISDPDGALTDVLNGSADVYTTDIATSVPQVKAGKLKVLAVTSPDRITGDPIAANFKTLKEQGVDTTFINWRGFFGPPNMDPAAIKFYEDAFKKLSDSPEWAKVREQNGWKEDYMNHDDYVKFLDQQQQDYASLLKEIGISK